MYWTKRKPEIEGYYWVKMESMVEGFPDSVQPPRIVKVEKPEWDEDGEVWMLEADEDYQDGRTLAIASEEFWWSSNPVRLPTEFEPCGCADVDGAAACSRCGDKP